MKICDTLNTVKIVGITLTRPRNKLKFYDCKKMKFSDKKSDYFYFAIKH